MIDNCELSPISVPGGGHGGETSSGHQKQIQQSYLLTQASL